MDRKIDSVLEKQGYTKCAHCAIDWTEIKATILAEIEKALPKKKSSPSVSDLQVEMLSKTYDQAYNIAIDECREKVRELLR